MLLCMPLGYLGWRSDGDGFQRAGFDHSDTSGCVRAGQGVAEAKLEAAKAKLEAAEILTAAREELHEALHQAKRTKLGSRT